jgi:hypothetical protein
MNHEDDKCIIILVGNPEGKRPHWRPRCKWEDNIKMDLKEIGYEDDELIYLAEETVQRSILVNNVINLR